MNATATQTTATNAETPVTVAAPTAHEIVTETLAKLSESKANGEVLRIGLANLIRRLEPLKPVKPEFSKVKEIRKEQMTAFKKADTLFRSALKRVYVALEDAGAEHKDRHSASLSASGIVTVRRSEALTLRPIARKGDRVSL